jgi:hypothetical protein
MVAAQGLLGRGHMHGGGGRSSNHCTWLSGSDPIWGGQWGEEERQDRGGITWQTTSGWGRRRRRCCAARVTMTMMMMAMGEEEVEGEMDVEGEGGERRGRGLFSGPCHSKLVSFIVTILTLHLFHYLYCLGAAHPLLILEAFLTSFLFFSSSIRARPKPSSPINLALNFASE